MKKIFFTLVLIIVMAPLAQAGIMEGRMTDNDMMLKTDYSESAARIIDTVRHHNNYDMDYYYERVYTDSYPEDFGEYAALYYRKIKAWFDPMADDRYFGDHEVNFDNKFFQMEPSFRDYLRNAKNANNGRVEESL